MAIDCAHVTHCETVRSGGVGHMASLFARSCALALLALGAGCNGCDAVVLSGDDAGCVDCDAGVDTRDAGVDADAGFPDEEDAGFPDAGPRCELLPLPPPVPWDCEDDVDWCDAEGDWPPSEFAPIPTADLRAVWSRVEGADFVIEARYANLPFRAPAAQVIQVVFQNAPIARDGPADLTERPGAPTFHGNAMLAFGQPPFLPVNYIFPPQDGGGNENLDFDVCNVFLSLDDPLIQVRVPADNVISSSGEILYGLMSLADPTGTVYEVTWNGSPQPITPSGGSADTENGWFSVCDLTCEDGGRLR